LRVSVSFIFIAAFVLSCSPKHIPYAENGILNPPQKAVESVSFNELYLKVLEPKCIGCHGTSGNVNLESLTEVRKHIIAIKNSVLISRNMPKAPFSALSNSELELVSAWVKANGPDQPLNGELAPTIPLLEPNFQSIYQKVIVPRCIVCHREGGEAPRVPLNTVADLTDSPLEIVIPENPDESGLMIVVQPGARKKMPPLKSAIGPLNLVEIEAIRTWIAAGAKE